MRRGDTGLNVRDASGVLSPARLTGEPGATTRIFLGTLVAVVSAAAATAAGSGALAAPLALAALAALIAFPPVLLAAFVFVPFFEAAPLVRSAPFDPTVTLGAVLLAVIGHRLVTHRVARVPSDFVIPVIAIGIALAVGLIGTPAPEYGTEKVLKFFTVTLLATLAPFFVIRTRAELVMFLWAIAAGGVLVAAVTPFVEPTVLSGITTQFDIEGRYSFGGQIFPARFLCTAALILLVMPGFTQGRWRYLAPIAALGVIFVALGFGARGPIGAFAAALAAVVLFSALRAPRQLVMVLVVVVLGGIVMPFVTLPGQSSDRLTSAVSDPVGVLRSDTRSAVYDQALRLAADNSLTGIGTGGFSTYTSVISPPKFPLNYPHNIFLELASEVGVLPALLLALLVVAGSAILLRRLRLTRNRADRHLVTLVAGLFLLNFLATQFSGDINDNRTFFLFLAIAWLVGRDGLPRTAPAQPA